MTDPLLDDVKTLLDKDFGDDRILKQIHRACENNEVISNYERNYVRKLAEKYLGRRPEVVHPQTSVEQKPIVPDVIIPKTLPVQKSQISQLKSTRSSSSNSKNLKIMLGVGGLGLVIIIAVVAASLSGISGLTSNKVETSTNLISTTLSIKTDLSFYDKKDLISISGVSDISGIMILSIENQNNELVWTERVSLKSNGNYSTLVIAGGPGWESSGTYTIKVDNGVDTKSSTFSFTA